MCCQDPKVETIDEFNHVLQWGSAGCCLLITAMSCTPSPRKLFHPVYKFEIIALSLVFIAHFHAFT